ncbi:Carnosine N-methyltransferase [Cercospora beticola]|uniref:Carnosine N-methyltransferase n=1 Tax=Cercospora beticola TaxID=122368 RepID=A0A2G5HE19_CERBT|nr:Carnosine N-methyltransferase [Cercospora beticola]PIA90787.1 Carnosine N-methyltransferase [Cercospora beticola]WPB08332.1 hypothetical protein RHO25_012998 [Cercospora beticola]
MSMPNSFWLTLIQLCVLAGLVRLASSHVESNTCRESSSIYYTPACPADGQRHEIAREQLLKSIDRNIGKWNKKHPRWQVLEALDGYDKYEKIVGAEIDRFERLYKHVPKKHKKILDSVVNYQANFAQARTLLKTNAEFCKKVLQHSLSYYNISRHELATFIHDTDDGKAKSGIRTTVSQSLKHSVRDWSPEGQAEREATFLYILDALTSHLPPISSDENVKYHVLVPGAGLGRLAHEISLLGDYMSVTSNERSSSMNMAYRYLRSLPASHGPITLHPFLENWSHAERREELTRPVLIHPPIIPTETLLVEGDFTTKFVHQNGQYDAVATLFFIDTARNLIAYLETIHSLLKPGGIWVNVGPLLYGTAPLVQLSLEEVVLVAESMGFEFEIRESIEGRSALDGKVEERDVLYNFNQSTLYRHGYIAACWVARKKKIEHEEVGGKRKIVGSGVFDKLKEKWL